MFGRIEYRDLFPRERSLRILPGQYFDTETGKHYNYYRDYDSSLGRYIQSDPLGLSGGLSTYSYVYDPLTEIDPLGLMGRAPGPLKPGPAKPRGGNDLEPCKYYDGKCAQTGCGYYCVAAPTVCRNAGGFPFHYSLFGAEKLNCIRKCLVAEDKKRHDERAKRCEPGKCLSDDDINEYHLSCFTRCGAPTWTYPGWAISPLNPQR